ncbi:ATP-binding protein [Deinococcus oregonensis]|uniref:histidine kinase n=1 Tax=Deinococcus oregonensis TaxID=1805970 RepID=A0ABV6AV72_9DEIO
MSSVLRSALFPAALDCIISIDPQGQITEWNRDAEQTLGYARAEALGQFLSDLIVPPADQETHQNVQRFLHTVNDTGQTISPVNQRLRLDARRRDGQTFPCELSVHALHREDGPLFAAYLRDLSDQVQAQAHQAALYAVSGKLAQAVTPAEVVELILREVMPAAQAARGSVGMLLPGGDHLRLLGELNYDAQTRATLANFPLTFDLPACHVIRTGQAVFGSREALHRQFSDLAQKGPQELMAAAALPLQAQGRVFGYLALVYDQPHTFAEADQSFLTAIAEHCALALHRAQLLEDERAARGQLAFLAEAGAVLASSLELQTTLDHLADLVVPRLADWYAVYLPEGEVLYPYGLAHRDAAKVSLLRDYVHQAPVRIDSSSGAAEIYRTGTHLHFPHLSPALLAAQEISPEQQRRVQELGLHSYMAVPMVAHGRTIGVMAYALAETQRSFTAQDLHLALELGRRAGLALDHARLYQQLQESHSTLERRVEVRTHELELQTQELERSNAELEQFAYIASHDLQAPIRAVTSFAGIIAQRYAGQLDDRGQLYLQQIIGSGEHMKRLVDDLLTFSRIHTHQGDQVLVDSQAVFGEVARRLASEDMEGTFDLSATGLPRVRANPQQLDQLLQNLISNGLKYRREGVRPRVQVSAVQGGDFWRFAVSDNGIGIEEQYFGRIFEIFQRLHGRDTFEGTGIGLAVCKKIVERHGGQLWLESVVGEGSSFFFTLPVE